MLGGAVRVPEVRGPRRGPGTGAGTGDRGGDQGPGRGPGQGPGRYLRGAEGRGRTGAGSCPPGTGLKDTEQGAACFPSITVGSKAL